MNFLQICQRAVLESGASGVAGSTTVVSPTGEWKRFVTWANQAWLDIQEEQEENWLWMRGSVSFATVTQQGEYSVTAAPLSLTDFASWRNNNFRVYQTSIADEIPLNYLDYYFFRDQYLIGTTRTSYSRPSVITVSPTKSLILALPPNDTSYTVTGDYQKTPTSLSVDSDTPGMPSRFHMMIVWKTLMHYGGFESSPEAYSRGQTEYDKLMYKLMLDQLPKLRVNRRFL